ncbi:hypothetical protein [Ferrovum sp.]|jgi:hypothetical protein|uniref:hypothetical protein n=1 Tax=Ferrovum sp. TaxID=2609467 RepID=UPI0026025EC2|nr:hypothetical protein [Ferrovum sp.]
MITIVEFFPGSDTVSWAAERRLFDEESELIESELLIAFGCKVYRYTDPGGETGWAKIKGSPFVCVKEMRNLKQAGASVGAYINGLRKDGLLSKWGLIGDYSDFSEFYRMTYGKPWVESQTFQIPTRVWAGRHLVGW